MEIMKLKLIWGDSPEDAEEQTNKWLTEQGQSIVIEARQVCAIPDDRWGHPIKVVVGIWYTDGCMATLENAIISDMRGTSSS